MEVQVQAEKVLRSEGLVWRYRVKANNAPATWGPLTDVKALEVLDMMGYSSAVSARGILHAAQEVAPLVFTIP